MSAGRTATRPRTPSVEIENALIDAAERVLMRHGPQGVTVRAVAAEASVAPMGVYTRFGGKDGLVDRLLIRGFRGLCAAIDPDGHLDASGRLRQAGHQYRAYAIAHPELYRSMFDNNRQQEESEELQSAAAAAFEGLVNLVRLGMASGDFRAGDSDAAARHIWCAVHGGVQLELTGLLQVTDAETVYAGLLDLLIRGLADRAD
jgi:AcrR family transcriptional regulator